MNEKQVAITAPFIGEEPKIADSKSYRQFWALHSDTWNQIYQFLHEVEMLKEACTV